MDKTALNNLISPTFEALGKTVKNTFRLASKEGDCHLPKGSIILPADSKEDTQIKLILPNNSCLAWYFLYCYYIEGLTFEFTILTEQEDSEITSKFYKMKIIKLNIKDTEYHFELEEVPDERLPL